MPSPSRDVGDQTGGGRSRAACACARGARGWVAGRGGAVVGVMKAVNACSSRRRRGHVARRLGLPRAPRGAHFRRIAGNGTLLDRQAVGVDDQVEQLDHPVDRVQGVVGLDVLAEDREQLAPVREQLAGAVAVLRPADEVLLAGVADDVGVGVAEADERERAADRLVVAAQLLVAGLDVDARVVGQHRCCCSSDDRRRRRRSRSRRPVLEAREVDVEDVVDLQPGKTFCLIVWIIRLGPPSE